MITTLGESMLKICTRVLELGIIARMYSIVRVCLVQVVILSIVCLDSLYAIVLVVSDLLMHSTAYSINNILSKNMKLSYQRL